MSNLGEKVTIVVPIYNNEKFIEKCMRSLLNQTYKNLEIIAINDGSEDDSHKTLKLLAQEDERIRYYNQENHGVSYARNEGVKRATGKYITFVDGDDYVGENYILDLYSKAKEHNADMVVCGLRMIDVHGNIVQDIVPGDYIKNEKEEWMCRISAVAAHFYRKDLWDKYNVRFVEGERGEDIPISLLFSAVCETIVTLKKADYYYVQHTTSASHNFQGLRNFKLPYVGLENAIKKINEIGIKNSKEFHELFVLRVLATFIQLAKGGEKEEICRLCEYIDYILDTYYPNYYKNRLVGLFSKVEITFYQKFAVLVLVKAKKWGMLRLLLTVACK